ncbi:4-(cytidine 5'-diphospho)-2-C-methyl-D-erythritol kinase [Alphaproteobacteria bacterium]|nr:4-(cytidine 5'-diphospho)-2-C-methyl-D-erythritol kinase [Alphaproteobacteria bacterium]
MKNSISLIAPAKLNLNLYVKDKLENGYHSLESDICFLDLHDEINIKISNINKIKLSSKSIFFLKDENILSKTLKFFNDEFGKNDKFNITLKKNIPIGAGLGGGSSDSAALLLGLRYFYNINPFNSEKISLKKLKEIGFKIGSDVPACIMSKSVKLTGIGEQLKKIHIEKNYKFLLIYPNKTLSTQKVFNTFDFKKNRNKKTMYFNKIKIFNSLTFTSQSIEPEIKKILNILKSFDKIVAFGMSGSGSSCFGIFKNSNDLINDKEFKKLKLKKNYFIWHGNKKEFGYNRIIY